MYTIKEITKIIANCKNENELLTLLLIVNKYKKSFALLDLFLIDSIARQKIQMLNECI